MYLGHLGCRLSQFAEGSYVRIHILIKLQYINIYYAIVVWIYLRNAYIYHIYIYIERERDRERGRPSGRPVGEFPGLPIID